MLSSAEIIKKYINFFKKHEHVEIKGYPIVLQNDPTTLFTNSGMQPLVPYLLGEQHPEGNILVNVQNCFRSLDINEVGDNRHTTFFRMLGNWSLGAYFKEKQIPWFWEFLTKELNLPLDNLHITVFKGGEDIPRDEEALIIWEDILIKEGLDPKEKIHLYGFKENWWSRAGTPDNMPVDEPGGPSSEIFYEFTDVDHDMSYGEKCHPNCNCGKFVEIGNCVFMQYQKQNNGSFKKLSQKNVDFGGGLERLAAALNNNPDIFTTDLYEGVIKAIEDNSGKKYEKENMNSMRIIADHLKGAIFLIKDGVIPSNKEHGYILRRLLRRSAVKMHLLSGGSTPMGGFENICDEIIRIEENIPNSGINRSEQKNNIFNVIKNEMERFGKSLDNGLKEIEKLKNIKGKEFYLFQTFGFPIEIIEELAKQKNKEIDIEIFYKELEAHRDLSRAASAGKFKGGLMDNQEMTIMGHTATHLLHQALRDTLGKHVHQTGSNITAERLRFDFNYKSALTDIQIKKIENIINQKISDNLPVYFEIIETKIAKKIGAIGLFQDSYGDKSKIYFIGGSGDKSNNAYSIEFCGGPHVDFTGKLKRVNIIKQESIGQGQQRIYAKVNI